MNARTAITLAGAGLFASILPTTARADEFTDRVNQPYTEVPASRHGEQVILPALAKIQKPPRQAEGAAAFMLPKGGPGWNDAAAWATGDTQKAALEALKKITGEDDWKKAQVFALPYGIDGVAPDLVRSGMYVDLDDPPTLAARRPLYMPAVQSLQSLVHVEATRLAGEGKPNDAIDVLIQWTYFCRQLADRPFNDECRAGLSMMIPALERIRDVAYLDVRGPRLLADERLVAQIKKLDPDNGFLDLGRLRMPLGERAAAEQLVAKLYRDGKPDPRLFAATMARVGSAAQPLRLFSESAKWRGAAGSQIPADRALRTIDGVFSDFQVRWSFEPFDRRMAAQPTFSKMQAMAGSAAVLQVAISDLAPTLTLRRVAKLEAEGARDTLGMIGLYGVAKNFPPSLSSIRPKYLKELGDDPFNPNRDRGARPPLEYFVPQRDTPSKDPYEINIVGGDGRNFGVKLQSDTFVIYSWGGDNAKNFAKKIQNTGETVAGADYLIYPPVLSLQRQYLIDLGDIRVEK